MRPGITTINNIQELRERVEEFANEIFVSEEHRKEFLRQYPFGSHTQFPRDYIFEGNMVSSHYDTQSTINYSIQILALNWTPHEVKGVKHLQMLHDKLVEQGLPGTFEMIPGGDGGFIAYQYEGMALGVVLSRVYRNEAEVDRDMNQLLLDHHDTKYPAVCFVTQDKFATYPLSYFADQCDNYKLTDSTDKKV